jgi:hypothetical protein
MQPPFIVQTIDRFFWNGAFWDTSAIRAKLFHDRGSALVDLERNGQTEEPWLIRPAALYVEVK